MTNDTNKDNLENLHTPVLLEQILEFSKTEFVDLKGKIAFDGTFGGGGYSQKMAELGMQIFACDQDNQAFLTFQPDSKSVKSLQTLSSTDFYKNLVNYPFKSQEILLTKNSFSEHIREFPTGFFDLVVLDLGFSSNQLEYSNRGFSYQKTEEVLDLRYNSEVGSPCWLRIQRFKKPEEFFKTLYLYSGEKLSKPISEALNKLIRSKRNYETVKVGEVVEAIREVIPHRYMKNFKSILSRIWQALRIWTNREMEELELFLGESLTRLKPNGLLMIVDFHSLEDKMITKFMRDAAKPLEVDEFGNKKAKFKLLTPKAAVPTEQEINQNIRSRSAKLRILKKLDFEVV